MLVPEHFPASSPDPVTWQGTIDISVLRTPGHTKEDASLVVETAEGTYVLTHLWWLDDMTPETDPIAWKQEALDASRAKVVAIADWIISGHGKAFRNPRKG